MSEAKRHHYVPQFYLERFARNGALELLPREDIRRAIPSSVAKALAENYFYSLETEDGRDGAMEQILANYIEDPAAEAIRRLVEGRRSVLAPSIRNRIALLMGFQRIRGPGQRHAMVEHSKATYRMVASMATPEAVERGARERGEEISEEEISETVELAVSGKFDLVVKRAANLHLGAFKGAFEIAERLLARTWQLVEFDHSALVTSDEPVALVGFNPKVPGEAIGLGKARAVVFPLDPRHALVLLRPNPDGEQHGRRGDATEAGIINRHVAFCAHRFIVRHPGTDPLAGIVLPKKAPPVYTVDNMIAMQPNSSVEARANYLARIDRGEIRFTRAPDDDDDERSAAVKGTEITAYSG